MIRYLIPREGAFYKANLHAHSTVSDGEHTPEERKAEYLRHGYSILALTDHNTLVDHSELSDDRFLMLTSTEIDITERLPQGTPFGFFRTYHINLYAKDPHEKDCPWVLPSFQRVYSTTCVNALLKEAKERGYLTCYNHPGWSMQHYPDYADLENVDFMELHNTESYHCGVHMDHTDVIYQDMLCLGKKIMPVCTDDSHTPAGCFGGWTMIKAPSLAYHDVITAMARGDLYASWGPSIEEIAFDTEKQTIRVACSAASEIFLVSERRFKDAVFSESGNLTNAEFSIGEYLKDNSTWTPGKGFLRIVIIDPQGRKAFSRAYGLSEFL